MQWFLIYTAVLITMIIQHWVGREDPFGMPVSGCCAWFKKCWLKVDNLLYFPGKLKSHNFCLLWFQLWPSGKPPHPLSLLPKSVLRHCGFSRRLGLLSSSCLWLSPPPSLNQMARKCYLSFVGFLGKMLFLLYIYIYFVSLILQQTLTLKYTPERH